MVLKILPLTAVLAATASAQTAAFSCVPNAGAPPIVRVEGHTEPVGDVLVVCTGGAPTPSGQPIPTVNIQISLNANVTSRLVSGNVTEAALMIDDPWPLAANAVPNNLTAPLNSPLPVLCPIGSNCADTGGSGVANPYGSASDPYLNQPNVFLGTLTGPNTIVWSNIPLDPPGDVGTRIFRLTNVRVNAAQIGISNSQLPDQVVMTFQITGAQPPALNNPMQTVGYVQQGLIATGDSKFPGFPGPVVQACTTHNASLLGGAGTPAFDFTLSAYNVFDSELRRRNAAITSDGNNAPSLASQNIPGYNYWTESMFYSPALFSTAPNVGLADFGTRIQVVIRNSAAGSGLHFFVPQSIVLPSTSQPLPPAPPPLAPGISQGLLRLVTTDVYGMSAPGFTPAASTASIAGVPVVEMSYSGGVAYATYEVLNWGLETGLVTVTVPVAMAFNSNSISEQPLASLTFVPSGSASTSIGTADASAPVPRFDQSAAAWSPYIAYPCALSAVTNPIPANGATQVALNPTLQWQAAAGASSYDVYFGSDQTPPTKVAAAITTTTYSPGTLAASTVYYWRVVANYPSGSAPSPMWSFNTLAAALTITKTHVGNFRPGQQNAAYAIVVSNPAGAGVTNANQPLVTVNETLPDSLTLVSMSGSGWSCSGTGCSRTDALAAGASYPPITVTVNVASNAPAQVTNNVNVQWYAGASWVRSYGQDITNILPAPVLTTALGFFPLTPCRMVDTRASQHKTGAFGPPALVGYTGRNFPLLDSGCAIPNTAQAYSVNATVVPPGALDFLSAWPAGKPFPNVSTLNSPDGSTLANAAILPAGTNGAVTVTAGQSTDLILDINGYFAPPNGQELVFYPVTPCRVADTRTTQGKTGAFGPPALSAYTGRNFTFADSNCGVPGTAQAYSLNMTVVPHGALDFLSAWPANKPFPNVSTLNSPDGSVIANAAIVPAGSNGAITVTAGNPTDLIIDVNGYFAPPGAPGALHFYALSTPCRIADTRPSQGQVGSFGPPALAAYSGRSFPVLSSACNIPATAQAYALNVTAIPSGQLDFLSIWPAGKPFPNVSTLNAPKGLVLANAAIVPAGTNGAIMLTAGNPTDIVIDINGYFAP